MPPSFLSKFVKQPTLSTGRASSETPSSPERPSSERRPTSSTFTTTSTLSPSNRDSVHTNGSTSSHLSTPNVNIVPPSPSSTSGFPDLSDAASTKSEKQDGTTKRSATVNVPSSSVATNGSDLPTPTATSSRSPSATLPAGERPKSPNLSPSSSATNLKKPKSQDLKRQRSDKSLNLAPINISHARAATEPPTRTSVDEHGVLDAMTPIVESPTAIRHEFIPPAITPAAPNSNNSLAPRQKDADTASIISANNDGKKRRNSGWRRGSTNTKKPTGLASAIAASGLAMANPTLSASQQAQLSPTRRSTSQQRNSRKSSVGSVGYYMTSSPPGSGDFSAAARRSVDKEKGPNRRRTNSTAVSVRSGDHSDARVTSENGNYSGLEDSSDDDDDDYESDDGLLDQISGDIPVTGFAVASNKRNADFHELFPTIPEGDYLIDDYGCALQREILIQGRIYISENHICFHANIFGWITDLVIPIYDVLALEKKMTAFVIPNAIMISTRQNKYTFASFLARDTTYDVIYNIWRLVRPVGEASERASLEESANLSETASAAPGATPGLGPKVTKCKCGKEGKHYAETALETIIPGTPERIYNLIFASGFIKDFMRDNQKLMDIQISDWAPVEPGSKLLARNMSYIKPLNASIGPKQTKCEIRDETVYCDFDDYVATITTTRTPEVPSGGAFSVKTRTCIMWASAVSSRVIVTTEVEWTGRSFIKGIIEKSAIDGQKTYHSELDRAVRTYIQEHSSEFIPEGVSLDEVAPTEAKSNPPEESVSPEEDCRKREHERNQRSLQWAWDTFSEAYEVAKRSTTGALELVTDAWEQSTSTTILYFVIVLLVLSNLWTLTRMGQKEEIGRRKEMRKMEEREKWIQSIVATLWEEIKGVNGDTLGPARGGIGMPPVQGDLKSEVAALSATLDAVEERIRDLRSKLPTLEKVEDLD